MNRHYFVYVTANDVTFLQDYVNLYLTRKYDPGVPMLETYIVVSEAKAISRMDRFMLRVIMQMLARGNHIRCRALILTHNRGWDFSSTQAALTHMKGEAKEDDVILVRNRSTRGPFKPGWFKAYRDVLDSSGRLALVGSSIGFKDHPKRKRDHDIIHVQTYVYASRWKYLASLWPSFPGVNATNHLEAVYTGEIELSQRLMQSGWSIASLQYPGMEIDRGNQNQYTGHADRHPPSSENHGPIVKRRWHRTWKDYMQILPILITLIWYGIPATRKYEFIPADESNQ